MWPSGLKTGPGSPFSPWNSGGGGHEAGSGERGPSTPTVKPRLGMNTTPTPSRYTVGGVPPPQALLRGGLRGASTGRSEVTSRTTCVRIGHGSRVSPPPTRSQSRWCLSLSPWVPGGPAGLWSPHLPLARPVPMGRQAGMRATRGTWFCWGAPASRSRPTPQTPPWSPGASAPELKAPRLCGPLRLGPGGPSGDLQESPRTPAGPAEERGQVSSGRARRGRLRLSPRMAHVPRVPARLPRLPVRRSAGTPPEEEQDENTFTVNASQDQREGPEINAQGKLPSVAILALASSPSGQAPENLPEALGPARTCRHLGLRRRSPPGPALWPRDAGSGREGPCPV